MTKYFDVILSAFLLTFGLLKKLEKSGFLSRGEWIYYYVHRYWRLMPPFMIIIAIYAGIFNFDFETSHEY